MSPRHLRGPIILSILAALLTIGLKTTAFFLTHSVGLLSDALESGVNLLAALTAYFSLWYAARPADPTHTYGHEKMEYFSSGLEGMFILFAGVGTGVFAIRRLIAPAPLEDLDLGLAIGLLATLINFSVAIVLLRAGHKYHSIVLEADGQHLMTDVWTSLGILLGIVVVWLTGQVRLDPVIALLVALNILWTGYKLIRRSIDGLMDRAWPDVEQDQLRGLIAASLPAGTTFHALRTRRAGARRIADFHLLVPGKMSVREGHDLVERIEAAIGATVPNLEVTIHIEPIEEEASYRDNALAGFEREIPPPAPPAEERPSPTTG
jgi:cation diffusion facilitator family transporter